MSPRRKGWSGGKIAFFAGLSIALPIAEYQILIARSEPPPEATTAPAASGPASPTDPRTAITPTAAHASGAPTVAPAPSAVAVASAPQDGKIDGLDAAAWRQMLRSTAAASEWGRASTAVAALAKLDPSAFAEADLRITAANVAAATELVGGHATEVWDALGSTREGTDVLYDLVSRRGGSKGATHALELLGKPEVRAQASPALLIAVDFRAEPCGSKEALLDRVIEQGDERVFVVLMALRPPRCVPRSDGCCFRENDNVEHAVKELATRLKLPIPDSPKRRSKTPPPEGTDTPATAAPPTKAPPTKPPTEGGDTYD